MGLTVKEVEKLLGKNGEPGVHLDEKGLYLQVVGESSRSWLLRYERNGRERWMGLGSANAKHGLTLGEAREAAKSARELLRNGIDPIDHRKAEKERLRTQAIVEAARTRTFEQAAKHYFDFHSPKWRNAKHRNQFLSTLQTYAYPVIGKVPVGSIDSSMVVQILQPIWATKHETASRVRGRIENVLNYAKVQKWVQKWHDGNNPAEWGGNLEHALPAPGDIANKEHHPALPWVEIPAFMVDLRKRHGVAAKALDFLILTATRTGEIIGARWGEFDLDAKTWTIPAGRMKAEKEHKVPLSSDAVKILKDLPREPGSDFLFIGDTPGEPISNAAMAAVVKRMNRENEKAGRPKWMDPKLKRPIVPHGFRSTFEDWTAETTNFPEHVWKKALAHTIGDKVEKAYRRGNLFAKRTKLMTAWARYCASPPKQQSNNGATVIPIRGRA